MMRRRGGLPLGPALPPAPETGANLGAVVAGTDLCALRVWNEREWRSLPASERPAACGHVPPLGWVGAVPRADLGRGPGP